MTVSVAGYITIDGKYYKVLAPDYKRSFEPAKTARRGVLGNTIVSIGPGKCREINQRSLVHCLCASYWLWKPGRSANSSRESHPCPTPTTLRAIPLSGDQARTTSRS